MIVCQNFTLRIPQFTVVMLTMSTISHMRGGRGWWDSEEVSKGGYPIVQLPEIFPDGALSVNVPGAENTML